MIQVLPFLNNAKDLDLSYKTDLDFWDCFRREKKILVVKVCYLNIADGQYGISLNTILERNRIPEKTFFNQIMR